MDVPISWKLSVQGSQDVKQRLADINAQFDRGEISAQDYAKGIREVNRDARSFVNISSAQKNIFLATHPMYNQISRSLSTVAGISRTLLSITNALNLARIAGNGMTSEELDLSLKKIDIMRALNTETDPSKIQGYQEELNLINKRLKEIGDEKISQGINNTVTAIGSLGLGLHGIAKIIPQLLPVIAFFKNVGLVGGIFVALATGIAFAAEALYKFLFGIEDMDAWRASNVTALINFFTIDIPMALGQAGQFITNFFLKDLPKWIDQSVRWVTNAFSTMWDGIISFFKAGFDFIIKGINDLYGSILKFVNDIINLFSKIIFGKKSSSSNTSSYSGMQGSQVTNSLHAATGFEGMINTPTLMTVAENGSEYVSVTPHGGSPKGGSNITIIQNIGGSIIAEKQIKKMSDDGLKEALKRLGFTGY